MDTVKISKFIDCDSLKAIELSMNPEILAKQMPGVKSVKILKKKEKNGLIVQTVAWDGVLEAGPIKKDLSWIEEDSWDIENKKCQFVQTEGSFKIYNGAWMFEDVQNGCESSISLEYDAGVPLVGPLIDKLIKKVVIENLEALLSALEKVAKDN
ncbi:hypothetical protein CL659_02620 [bacterium]|nr:hypothetical protein [bacterium]|tara:strand:+ start:194 stop:655 length:462 start_codon:yes stop_codon:yes gene_type:complete